MRIAGVIIFIIVLIMIFGDSEGSPEVKQSPKKNSAQEKKSASEKKPPARKERKMSPFLEELIEHELLDDDD